MMLACACWYPARNYEDALERALGDERSTSLRSERSNMISLRSKPRIRNGGRRTVPWYACTVNAVGPASDASDTPVPVMYIQLTDTAGSFENIWFYAANGIQQQLLDVGIAAITDGKDVSVGAVAPLPGNQPFTEVSRIYGFVRPEPPAAPIDFHEISLSPPAAAGGFALLVVGWGGNFDNEVSFDIKWTGSDNTAGSQSEGANSATASLSLEAGYTYTLYVVAVISGRESAPSNTITVTIPSSAPPTTASLTASAHTGYPRNPIATGLYIEGNDFEANETVEVTVVWQVAGEAVSYSVRDQNGQNPTANLAGYFSVWWSPDSNGLCPYSEPVGTPQPLQQFNVTATGLISGRTASKTTTLICP